MTSRMRENNALFICDPMRSEGTTISTADFL